MVLIIRLLFSSLTIAYSSDPRVTTTILQLERVQRGVCKDYSQEKKITYQNLLILSKRRMRGDLI